MKPGKSLTAIKNVSVSEPFFQGHFPNQPVMPGVLIIEAMAQAGSFLLLHTTDEPEKKLMYFSGIDKSRFRRQVYPGDQIFFKVDLLNANSAPGGGVPTIGGSLCNGNTWRFQYWHRDGMNPSRFSKGIAGLIN